MQNGSYQAPSIAYGYKKEDGKIVIDEPKAKMVKQIFEWYLSGIGVTTITAELKAIPHNPCASDRAQAQQS